MTTSPETKKIIDNLRRKTFDDPDAQHEPPPLTVLMDRARSLHEHPERYNEIAIALLIEALNEAQECLDAVWAAVVDPPVLKRVSSKAWVEVSEKMEQRK